MSQAPSLEIEAKEVKGAGSHALATATRAMAQLNEWIMKVATVALLCSALVLTLGVLLRYFFKVPTDWQDETAVFLIVGAIFMCGAYVQSYRGHVGIEAVASVLPESINRVRRIMVDFASFGFCSFFSWKSWALLAEAVRDGQTTSSSFAPPLWIPYGMMSVGMTILSLQVLLQIMGHFAPKGRVP